MASIGAIFVDGGNMSHALKEVQIEGRPRIDYTRLVYLLRRRLLAEYNANVQFLYLCYYEAYRTDNDKKRRALFHEVLKKHGWSIFSFPAKECSDGVWRDKGLDLSLALDAYRLAILGQINYLVVMSHDEDFAALFERLPKNVTGVSLGWRGRTALRIQKVAPIVWFIEDLGKEAVRV